MRFVDQVAVVTGGGSGIGRAIASVLSEEGASIVIMDVDKGATDETVRELGKNDVITLGLECDVSDVRQVQKAFHSAIDQFGRIDILVNNAGIQFNCPTVELSPEDWKRVLGVDLDGVFFCSQAAGRYMIDQKGGCIVNISSVAGPFAFPRRAPYCVSKSGVIALTKVLAAEWAEYNIRANAVAPGYVEAGILLKFAELGQVDLNELRQKNLMKRLADPFEVARTVAFLASSDASHITGETLFVDGGYSVMK